MLLKDNRGFTLLELLIAITLSILILVVLGAAMRLGYMSQSKGTERSEVTQKVRILEDRIAWLIRGTYPFFLKKPDEKKIFFDGKSDRVGFVTSSIDTHGAGPEDLAGLKWVSIFADNEGLKIREKIYFLEDVFEDSNGKVYLLDPEVKKIEFEFFEIKEGEKQGTWISEWDPKDKETIPAAVKVKITLERKGQKLEIPEMIVKTAVQRKPTGPR
ncbi:MAG: prepilin-type N-terminal cleavage/methylation domain-containing protein [Nitrospirae bacterium]|nr:prepilin-type N-terminal cleavage/methylation domain-containing protein [Nitrospirota bacterium]